MPRSSLHKKWRALPRRVRWAINVLASGVGAFLVKEALERLKPHLPLWWAGVVSAMQHALSYIPPLYWFALVAFGLALPLIWDVIASRGETLRGYMRQLRAKLPFSREADPKGSVLEPRIDLTCKVREQEQLPKGSPLTKWVQIVVSPSNDLIDCEVQIVSLNRNGECLYDEPLNCIWSNSRDIRRTIRAGIPQSASLCMADAGKPGLYLTTSVGKPQITRAMRKQESSVYRVDVAVHAANAKAKREWFVINYGGDFASIEIRPEA